MAATLTQQGFDELKAELDGLKSKKRPPLVARLANARDQGDLSENSDYLGAREELSLLDDRIKELEDVIITAKVATIKGGSGAGIGKTVTIRLKGKDKDFTYQLVGDWEADPKEKKISIQSPIGKALEGNKEGATVEVEAPAGVVEYEIVKIEK